MQTQQHAPACTRQRMLRTAQLAIAGAALALLAACGGGGDDNNNASNTPPSGVKMQVVSFGDSLSDAGTYSQIKLGFGGGRFTTNPGQVDAERRAVLRRHAAAREPGRFRHSAAGHRRSRLRTGAARA